MQPLASPIVRGPTGWLPIPSATRHDLPTSPDRKAQHATGPVVPATGTQPSSSAIYLLSMGSHMTLGPASCPAGIRCGRGMPCFAGQQHLEVPQVPLGWQAGPRAASRSSSWKGSRIFSWRAENNPGRIRPEGSSMFSHSLPASRAAQADPPQPGHRAAPTSVQLLVTAARRKPRASLGLRLRFYLRNAFCLGRDPRTFPSPQEQCCVSGTCSCRALSPSPLLAHLQAGGTTKSGGERPPADRGALRCRVRAGSQGQAHISSWESSGQEGAMGMGRNILGAGCPQPSPQKKDVSPLGELRRVQLPASAAPTDTLRVQESLKPGD